MRTFTTHDLRDLLDHPADLCLSLFVPAGAPGPEAQQTAIRLQQLLQEASELLARRGVVRSDREQLLAPIRELPTSAALGLGQGESLAIFAAPDLFRTYRLPEALPAEVHLADHFHIVPLLPTLESNRRYFILELSLGPVLLLRATRHAAEEVSLPGVPVGLEDALRYDEFAKQSQFHAGVPGRGGERGAIFHGHGSREDVHKQEVLRYFLQVERGVRAALAGEHAPLLLAGVAYLLPIYHEVNAYPHVLLEGIAVNAARLAPQDLLARAWTLVEPLFRQPALEAADRYRLLAGTRPARVSAHLRTIVLGAGAGQVETLFVGQGHHQWGQFDRASGAITLREEPAAGDVDLVNAAAVDTIRHHGAVYVAAADQMPERARLAAILRY